MNKSIQKTCCFTGHRPKGLPYGTDETHPAFLRLRETLRGEIRRLAYEEGVRHFIRGMAIGVDLLAAELVLEFREENPNITLESAIPHEEQSIRWTDIQRSQYYDVASQCDFETMLQTQYTPDCFQKRNLYMVEHSAFVVAVWNGSPGGTQQTVAMARKLGRKLTIINPSTRELLRENY